MQQPLAVHINPHNSLCSPQAGVKMRSRGGMMTRIQGVLPVAAACSLSPSGSGPWTTHWWPQRSKPDSTGTPVYSIHLQDWDPLLALQEQVPEAGCPGFGCQGPRWEVFTLLFMHFKYRNQLTTGMISEPFYQLIYLFKYFPVQWTIPTCRRQLKTDNKCLVRTLYCAVNNKLQN